VADAYLGGVLQRGEVDAGFNLEAKEMGVGHGGDASVGGGGEVAVTQFRGMGASGEEVSSRRSSWANWYGQAGY
jgi:hypothetical protein